MSGVYGIPSVNEDPNDLDQPYIIGQEFRLFQKIYFSKLNWDKYFYFRHGLRYSQATLFYQKEDWFPVAINGNTHLNFERRSFEDFNQHIGYEAIVGMEIYQGGFLFIDWYMGMAFIHRTTVNNEHSSSSIVSPLYSGLKPLFGVRVAAYVF